jgi:RNA polymerase sigma-70 factor (ECF subfamily)
LRSYLIRLAAHAQDGEDLMQDATLQAFRKLASFRGDSAFATWLFAIATRLALTHLRARKRWSPTVQLEMHDRAQQDPAFLGELGGEIGRPDFRYEVGEHVAYCFSCVGRSLDPEESAAVLLVEVFELPNRDAAKVLDLSESTLRHRLAAGRRAMETTFEGMCTLVNKQGACHQCATLRELSPPDRRGPDVPALPRHEQRLALVRAADVAAGTTAGMHAAMLRFIAKHAE